ncbi:MAG: UDP-N-acetylglucosamine 4,6-dehydratase [Campylobacterota bacterium]|nr:UDP-N-acetylglucosamine 4,6-dehydratase [Campylobacterota bacterium]
MIKKIITPTIKKRMLFFLINDMMISFFTFYLSYLLRFNFDIPLNWFDNFLLLFMILFLFKATAFYLFNIYSTPWRFFALDSFKQIVLAHIVSYIVFALFFWATFGLLGPIPRSVLVIDLFLSIFFIGALRVAKRIFIESSNSSGLATLIIGADSNGELAARYLMSQKSEFYPVAFVDSDENKISSYIHGIKIYDFKNTQNIIKKMDIEAAIISEKLPAKKMNELFDELKSYGIEKIKLMQFFESSSSKELKDISIEDLLAREPKDLDKNVIKNFIKDKTVLVTGAGGSIGSEICRQAAGYGAKKIIMVDNSEFNLYQITEELQGFNIASKLNSVLQKEKLDEIFANEKPDIVLHAAAYKHVPMVEENIECALENNIQGTINIIDLSIEHEVGTFILISTDKAVRPTNVMGATKRVCELYAMSVPPKNTKIAAVRFGNVLGSSGSVIPKFKEQIKKGGPLTVTHPEISRYFMLISEACELVLQAATLATDKEIFILDMGEPIKISDLAKKMLLLADREDIKIEYTGLRKGEKLYEELLIDENDKETKYSSIFIAKPEQVEYQEIKNKIQKIFSSKDKIKALQEMVPEFIHKRDNDK